MRAQTISRVFFLVLLGSHCGQPPARGAKHTGEPCDRDEDCTRGLCSAGVAGRDGHCTVSCAAQEDCPAGWSCTGLTQRNVVVCVHGDATPFGNGSGH